MSKVVLITGASSGIGKAAARLFHDKGWRVAATMRKPEEQSDLAETDRLVRLRLDVTDADSVEEAVAGAMQRFGGIDVVVNNAGYGAVGPFEASTEEQIQRQFETNVFGLMRVTRAVLPHFRERRAGTFVNVASMGGRIAFPLYSLYHGTKWAVEGFSEALQYEVRPFGIRIKIVEPGPIKTDFYDRSVDLMKKPDLDAYDEYTARTLPKMNDAGMKGAAPEAVAKGIYRAATDESVRMRYPVNARAILALRRMVPDRVFHGVMRAAVNG